MTLYFHKRQMKGQSAFFFNLGLRIFLLLKFFVS